MDRQLLPDHAADGESDERHPLDLEMIEQRHHISGERRKAVRPTGALVRP